MPDYAFALTGLRLSLSFGSFDVTMKLLWLIIVALLLNGCATTFTDSSKLAATISHRIEGNRILLTAKVANLSQVPITFVDYPDFCNFSILAEDRSKDEAVNMGMSLSFKTATKEHLIHVPPGQSAVFEQKFTFRRRPGGIIEIADGEPVSDNWSYMRFPYMRIRDTRLQARFHYGKYPDYLPENAWLLGRNYVMTDIGVKTVFPRP